MHLAKKDAIQQVSEQHLKIKFSCPSCGTKYTAAPEQAGKKGKCKKCGMQIAVPELESHEPKDEIPAEISGTEKVTWYNKKGWLVFWLIIFFPVGIYALAKNTALSRKYKIGLGLSAFILLMLFYSQSRNDFNDSGSYGKSTSSPVGRWTYDDASGWHYELRIFSSGKYIIEGPPGTDVGSWTRNGRNVTFYLEGIPVATGYRSGNYFSYDAGMLGTMRMSKQ